MIEFFTDKGGKWRFRVKGANGEKVATSQAYASKFNAERGADALRRAIYWSDQK